MKTSRQGLTIGVDLQMLQLREESVQGLAVGRLTDPL